MRKNKFHAVAFALLLLGLLAPIIFSFPLFTVKKVTQEKTDKVGSPGLITSDWNTSSTIYILPNGTVDPPTAPIQRNGSTFTLTDNILTSATQGISIERNNTILDGAGHTIQGANHGGSSGILIWIRSNVTVKHVLVEEFANGIVVDRSSNGTVLANTIINNSAGIVLFQSSNNTISENNVTTNNGTGIVVSYSLNNKVYHNNIINNTSQAYVSNSTGAWDNGYPSGGNYWSDYNGTDLFVGLYQTVAGNDGIGDAAKAIDPINKDDYPLMGPYGAATQTGLNATVFPSPDVGLIFENVTQAGSTTVNKTQTGPPLPAGLTLVGQYYNVLTTAGFSGNLTIRITYDDSNLTQTQENSFQLLQLQFQQSDVTGPTTGVPDGIVNMRDIGYFASKFMTTPSSPNWDPRCDVTGPIPGVPDGIVNMRDIGRAVSDFLKTGYWANITTYIDTLSNVIYGEAGHLSMFGVSRE